MPRDLKENVMKYVFLMSATLSIFAIVLIFYFIFQGALPFLARNGVWDFLTSSDWRPTASTPQYGIFPMLIGSLIITFGAIIIGVPIGILTAVFMAYFCPPKLYHVTKSALNLMAAIPSIVYGFFALQLLVPFSRMLFGGTGLSIITASILLGIMILPTVISLSEAAIRSVPRSYYDASIGLGATHERSVMTVIVPAAKSGILSSVILGIGRAIGETMAVILVAGNQPAIPRGLTDGIRTLTTNIVLEMGYASGEHREALIATAAVLFVIILIINAIFMFIKKKG